MRFLIYDNNINDLEKLCNMIQLYPIETVVDKVCDYNDCLEMYDKHVYDKVFIDFTDDIGKKIAKEISNINKNQKVFLLNNKLDCLDEKNCIECKKIYNRNTIIKPIDQTQLSRIISKNFSCESFKESEFHFNVKKIKKTIKKEYPYYNVKFNNENKILSAKQMSIPMLVFISDLLSNNNMDFQVLDYENIQILDPEN